MAVPALSAGRSRSRSPRGARESREPQEIITEAATTAQLPFVACTAVPSPRESREPRERGLVWQREKVCKLLRTLAAEQRTCHTCLEAFAEPADGQRVDFPVVPGCGHAVHGRCLAGQVISVNDDIQGKCGMCRQPLVLERRDLVMVYITALVQFVGSMKASLRQGVMQAGLKEGLQEPTRTAASRCLAEFCVKLYSRIGTALDLPGPASVLQTMGMSLDEDCPQRAEIHDIMDLALPLVLGCEASDDSESEHEHTEVVNGAEEAAGGGT